MKAKPERKDEMVGKALAPPVWKPVTHNVLCACATYCMFCSQETSAISFSGDNKLSNSQRVTMNTVLGSALGATK